MKMLSRNVNRHNKGVNSNTHSISYQAPYCKICQINLPHIKYNDHVMSPSHQLYAHQMYQKQERMKCGIFVSGLPKKAIPQEIEKFFSDIGRLRMFKIEKSNIYAIAQFEESVTAQKLINQRHIKFKDRYLVVKPRASENWQMPDNIGDYIYQIEKPIIKVLQRVDGFDEELSALLNYSRPTDRRPSYIRICQDLHSLLNIKFPGCTIHPFGSTITGLDTKTSDVDIFVSVPGECNESDTVNYVNSAYKHMFRSQVFSKCIKIPRARTPIIKCLHNATNICCDINFKSMLGVQNSFLISNYLRIHPILNTALIVLKLWAKLRSLTIHSQFNNYSLGVLYIFFLQLSSSFKFPSVFQLQKSVPPVILSGWNTSFAPLDSSFECLQSLNIRHLLYLFFDFYANYDFEEFVVCPHLGRSIIRSSLQGTLADVPEEFQEIYQNHAVFLKTDTPICVQDPLELTHNITRAVSASNLVEFKETCKECAVYLQQNLQNPRLLRLFHSAEFENEISFALKMTKKSAYLGKKIKEQENKFDTWFKFIVGLIRQYIELIMLMKTGEWQFCPDSISAHSRCKAYINVWQCRKIVSSDLHPMQYENSLSYQRRVSRYIADDLQQKQRADSPVLEVIISISRQENCKSALIHVQNGGSSEYSFKDFAFVFPEFVKLFYLEHITDLNENILFPDEEQS